MTTMGGTCSSQRPNSYNYNRRGNSASDAGLVRRDRSTSLGSQKITQGRIISRHSVVSEIPDESISSLYPLSDNQVAKDNGLRSPKSLAELCTDTLCRSLPFLGEEGSLPRGLPQDIVDDVVVSLIKHSALNATTLRVLKNCELASLSLAGCRGVTDAWFESLKTNPDGESEGANIQSPAASLKDDDKYNTTESPMELEEYSDKQLPEVMKSSDNHYVSSDVLFNTSTTLEGEGYSGSIVEESSCSTSSFVSAHDHLSSRTWMDPSIMLASKGDHLMLEVESSDFTSPHGTIPYGYGGENFTLAGGDCDVSMTIPTCDIPPSSSTISHITSLDLRGSHRLTDKGLMQLADLSSLEVVKLDGCFSIQGRGLLALSMSRRLHSLSLANCRRLNDEAVINISHLTSLESLSLEGCRCLTDRSMVAIGSLVCLKKVDLSQCALITDGGLEYFETLEEIKDLSLGWCRSISDNGVQILCRQPGRSNHLQVLNLARIGITDEGVEHLCKLKSLVELDLNGCSSIGSVCLGDVLGALHDLNSLDVSYCPGILRSSWQGKISALKRLKLCYSGVRDSHLMKITELPMLEELNLDSCPITDWSIGHLTDNRVAPNLTCLDLADTDLSDLGMTYISKFTKLKRLSLFYCNLTNSSLRYLSSLVDLEVLNLDSREIGDAGLLHLLGLKKLKALDIFSGRITDSGCHHITRIKSLESLELCGGGITDAGCAVLASLENLTLLNLSQNDRITNRGAAALAALSNLKILNLSNTKVNSGALIHFTNLKNLKSLAIYGCRGMDQPDSNDVLEKLQYALPNLKCLRLNNEPDDGVISTSEEDTDNEDFDSDSEQIVFSCGPGQTASGVAKLRSEESDSEMEDVPNAEEHDSDSSYSARD